MNCWKSVVLMPHADWRKTLHMTQCRRLCSAQFSIGQNSVTLKPEPGPLGLWMGYSHCSWWDSSLEDKWAHCGRCWSSVSESWVFHPGYGLELWSICERVTAVHDQVKKLLVFILKWEMLCSAVHFPQMCVTLCKSMPAFTPAAAPVRDKTTQNSEPDLQHIAHARVCVCVCVCRGHKQLL